MGLNATPFFVVHLQHCVCRLAISKGIFQPWRWRDLTMCHLGGSESMTPKIYQEPFVKKSGVKTSRRYHWDFWRSRSNRSSWPDVNSAVMEKNIVNKSRLLSKYFFKSWKTQSPIRYAASWPPWLDKSWLVSRALLAKVLILGCSVGFQGNKQMKEPGLGPSERFVQVLLGFPVCYHLQSYHEFRTFRKQLSQKTWMVFGMKSVVIHSHEIWKHMNYIMACGSSSLGSFLGCFPPRLFPLFFFFFFFAPSSESDSVSDSISSFFFFPAMAPCHQTLIQGLSQLLQTLVMISTVSQVTANHHQLQAHCAERSRLSSTSWFQRCSCGHLAWEINRRHKHKELQ